MACKVFLFNDDNWLYCSNVTLKDGVYHGWVENGCWHMVYNTVTGSLKSYRDAADARNNCLPLNEYTTELTWMCVPCYGDYNEVIEDAKRRYENKELASEVIGPDRDYERYLKLKEKYKNVDEYELYLDLKEKYENDDEVPF